MRRISAALVVLASLLFGGVSHVFAQAPPPVPALPDTERRTSYSISAATGPYNVNFAIYGDSTDYANWVEVWLDGVMLTPSTDWTLALTSGTLATAARPLSNAQITLTAARTGTLQIVGARRPRRTSQFPENRGVAARDLNQVITDITAQNRETWDKINDVTGRVMMGVPGETWTLPSPAGRAGMIPCFNGSGALTVCTPGSVPSITAPLVLNGLTAATPVLTINSLANSLGQGVSIVQSGSGTQNNFDFNSIAISADNAVVGTSGPSENFSNALKVALTFGGTATKGGRNAILGWLTLGSATNGANPYNFNTGLLGYAWTAPSVVDATAYLYGLGTTARVRTGSAITAVIGAELTTGIEATGSAGIRSALVLNGLGGHTVKGSSTDALAILTNQSGSAKWDYGILFSNTGGDHAFGGAGTLIGTSGAATVTYGVNIASYTCSTACWNSTGAVIDGSGNGTLASLISNGGASLQSAGALTLRNAGNTHRFAWNFGAELDLSYDGGAAIVAIDLNGGVHSAENFYSTGSKVVGARVTGYTAMTGTPNKATAYDTATVTLAQLAGRVMQLQADLTTHGLIGP